MTGRGAKRARPMACLLMLAALAPLAACKSGPAPNAGFVLERPEAQKPPDLPFHSAWFKPGVNWDSYTKVMVSAVDTKHLLPPVSPILTAGAGDREAQIQDLALYARQALKRAFRDDPGHRFQVVEDRGPGILDLEFAITDFTASRPGVNAVSFFFIYTAIQRGGVAMEARVRDSKSGETITTFADKENAPYSPIHADDFNKLGHSESVIDTWAEQMVHVLGRRAGEAVEDSPRIRLKPWREKRP
ncbi:MAG: DUF3313 family protein [Deltaproteobacteria bacterium]|nr:DUF3313 family protein [Deltaproteobacteria bacterium]